METVEIVDLHVEEYLYRNHRQYCYHDAATYFPMAPCCQRQIKNQKGYECECGSMRETGSDEKQLPTEIHRCQSCAAFDEKQKLNGHEDGGQRKVDKTCFTILHN